ncbi:MAG: dTMP kinase [Ignavibacteria bacterium]|nr:dTMP kinase [Ignavibacteria bacterium]
MFITFEGVDFCGKSTQIILLKKFLSRRNNKVKVIREPGGTFISEKIRNVLLDKKNHQMSDETELLLFSASRSQLVNHVILPYLEKNYYVLSDRFHDSSIAYQGYGRSLNLSFVKSLQKFVIGKAIPNLTFFLDIPIEEVALRMSKIKKVNLDRIETSKLDFYEKVRKGYVQLAKSDSRFITINGMLPKKDIHKEIITELEKYEGKIDVYKK